MSALLTMEAKRQADTRPGTTRFTWRARAQSFVFASRGLRSLLRHEHNAWIHLAAAVLACGASAAWQVSRWEWCLVVLCIGTVLAAEAFNTALESLANAIHPEKHPLVGRAKDLAAAGVLIVSMAAAAVGSLIFGPRLWELLRHL